MLKLITIVPMLLIAGLCRSQETAQMPVRTVTKPAYLQEMITPVRKGSTASRTDSIIQQSLELRAQNDSLLLLINDELSRAQSLEQQNLKLAEENRQLGKRLEEAEGEQLQTSHTSSVLLIFNIIAGIILLVALVWIFTRRKDGSDAPNETVMRTFSGTPPSDPVETRLERIEKLGRLRDKGLLTEDEFQLQKKQLLG